MKCPSCNTSLCWQSDCDYDDLGIEGNGIVGMYTCLNSDCDIEDVYIYMPINEENENN